MKKPMFLTPEFLEECLRILGPMITENFITKVPGRVAICIQVLDPTNPNAVPLWTGILGSEPDSEKWPHPYLKFVNAKAVSAFNTRMSNHEVQASAPYLLVGDDFKFGGGIYYKGLVVATSGAACWEEDVAISGMFIGLIEGLLLKAANTKLAQKILFLREELKD